MNKKVKEIASDAIFVGLLTVIIIIFKYLLFMLDSLLLLLISVFLGVRYHKANIIRQIIVSFSLFILSFIYFDFISILVLILPGIVVGIISHYLLKIVRNFPYYFLGILIYFIFGCFVEFLYAKLILNMDFHNYLLSGMEFPDIFTASLSIDALIILFLGYNILMAIMETFIIRQSVFIYEMRIRNNKKRL